jgi:hypothetical protein
MGAAVRPSVNLILNYCVANAAEKLQRRLHFAPTAPLLHNDLLQFSPPQPTNQTSLLAQEISLDPAIVRYLLDEFGLDADISSSCSLILATVSPKQTNLPAPLVQQISAIAQNFSSTQPIQLYLQSPDAVTSHQFAQVLAHQLSRSLTDR